MKKMAGFLLAASLCCGGFSVGWVDKNDTKHLSQVVKIDRAKSMFVRGVKLSKPRETRVKITQAGIPCFILTDDWAKNEYSVENGVVTLVLDPVGYVGAEVGFTTKILPTDIYLLGRRGCKEYGIIESWTVEQKIKGVWLPVAVASFELVK